MEIQRINEDRKKTYLIYKKSETGLLSLKVQLIIVVFDGVLYPLEKQVEMEKEEAEYAEKIGVCESMKSEFCKTNFQVLTKFNKGGNNVESNESDSYMYSKLQSYEQDAIESLMKISSEVELTLKHQSSPSNTSQSDQQLSILSALQNIVMLSLPALKNLQEGMLKQKNEELRHKANCEAKDIERKRIIKEHGMVEVECKLLEKYQKAIQNHLQAPTTPDDSDDQEPETVPAPMPGTKKRWSRKNFSTQKRRKQNSEKKSELPAQHIPGLPKCPETFLTTFNTIVLTRPRLPQQTLNPPRHLPRTEMQRLNSTPKQFINFKVNDSLRPNEQISITAGLSEGKGTVTFDTPILGISENQFLI